MSSCDSWPRDSMQGTNARSTFAGKIMEGKKPRDNRKSFNHSFKQDSMGLVSGELNFKWSTSFTSCGCSHYVSSNITWRLGICASIERNNGQHVLGPWWNGTLRFKAITAFWIKFVSINSTKLPWPHWTMIPTELQKTVFNQKSLHSFNFS